MILAELSDRASIIIAVAAVALGVWAIFFAPKEGVDYVRCPGCGGDGNPERHNWCADCNREDRDR